MIAQKKKSLSLFNVHAHTMNFYRVDVSLNVDVKFIGVYRCIVDSLNFVAGVNLRFVLATYDFVGINVSFIAEAPLARRCGGRYFVQS